MDISVEQIIRDENITQAMDFLMTKRDSCGIDGMEAIGTACLLEGKR